MGILCASVRPDVTLKVSMSESRAPSAFKGVEVLQSVPTVMFAPPITDPPFRSSEIRAVNNTVEALETLTE